jgi:hypothetical protein
MFKLPTGRLASYITLPVVTALMISTLSTVSRVSDFKEENTAAVASVQADARAAISMGEDLLAAAAAIDDKVAAATGKVLDDSVLTAETARADQFRAAAAALTAESGTASATAQAATVDGTGWYWDYDNALELLETVDFRASSTLSAKLMDTETANSNVIAVAVEAWEVEQARLAEVARLAAIAAEEARVAAAAAAARAAWKPSSSSSASSSNGHFNVWVRTGSNAANAQATIDGGGQVAVNYGGPGIVVSAHNFHDSTALRLRMGNTVTFSGAAGGTWRVVGFKDVVKGKATTADLASLGVKMMMQTCYFGSNLMRIVALAPA